MKLRDKLKRFRERAGEHFTILRCPECGEEIWGTGDIAMKVLVAEWAKGVGQERDPDPFVERVLGHPHEALLDEAFRDLPGVSA